MVIRIAIGLLLIVVVASGGQAAYLSGKAMLAQYLLERAWNSRDRQAEKPWPWADVHPVAKLTIPRLRESHIVLSGHSGEAMAFGPGLVSSGSGLLLAGHRDSHFAFLREIKPNDKLVLELASGDVHQFTIRETQIFNVEQYPLIYPPENGVALITCYPFDSIQAGGPLRFVATAD